MLGRRVIVTLLLRDHALVKTVKFKEPRYVGDPVNAMRIFSEMEVDELILLDISVGQRPDAIRYDLLRRVADECFMPLVYGGGVTNLEQFQEIFRIGFEKIAINTSALRDPQLVARAASRFGSQSIVGSIDVKRDLFGRPWVYNKTVRRRLKPEAWARELEGLGVGELLVNSVDRDGTWDGYDIELLRNICQSVTVPVIAVGGAGGLHHMSTAFEKAGVDAVGAGSLFVFQKKGMGVLINYPERERLDRELRHS